MGSRFSDPDLWWHVRTGQIIAVSPTNARADVSYRHVHGMTHIPGYGEMPPGSHAETEPASSVSERLHANAVDSFRQARFPEAYARFISLADAGHAPSAELALWMYLHGPSLFGRDWDSTQDQLTAWAQLAQQPVPTMVAHVYPQTLVPVASRKR